MPASLEKSRNNKYTGHGENHGKANFQNSNSGLRLKVRDLGGADFQELIGDQMGMGSRYR